MLSVSKATSCIISLGGQLQHLITLKPAGGKELLPLTPQQTLPNVQLIPVSSFQNNHLFVLNYSTPPHCLSNTGLNESTCFPYILLALVEN